MCLLIPLFVQLVTLHHKHDNGAFKCCLLICSSIVSIELLDTNLHSATNGQLYNLRYLLILTGRNFSCDLDDNLIISDNFLVLGDGLTFN